LALRPKSTLRKPFQYPPRDVATEVLENVDHTVPERYDGGWAVKRLGRSGCRGPLRAGTP